MSKVAIKVEHVGMKFNLSSNKVDNLKEYFIRFIKRDIMYKEFWALRDVNFTINKGDHVAILGYNGAGKSTILKIIAGVLKPTEGKVTINGKVVPLLELGAGFDPQYTGAENIYLYGAILGYTKEFIDSLSIADHVFLTEIDLLCQQVTDQLFYIQLYIWLVMILV